MNIAFETLGGTPEGANEDWVAANPNAVIVLDGVTAPRVAAQGCRHSVAWFTRNLGGRLLMLLSEDMDMSTALAQAIDQVAELHQNDCDLSGLGVPAAAVAMLRKRADGMFDYLVLADTVIVLDMTTEMRVISDTRVEQAAPEALAATRREAIGTPEHQAAVARMSVEQLKARNVPGGYWVAAAEREAAYNAISGEVPMDQVRRVAIFTDGASRAVDTFEEMDWTACLDYLQEHGPRSLIQHVRRIEETDPAGQRWPRFKKSDDATVAFVELVEAPKPRYVEIADALRARVHAGEWAPASPLPLDDLAVEYRAGRDTVARAIGVLEGEGYLWPVQGRGSLVRHGMMRLRRPRGNLVKRNKATNSAGYSFPSASSQEKWKHHIIPAAGYEPLTDPRIAKLLGVKPGTPVMRRFRVTGPESEPPFQINTSWIHPRGVADAPEVVSEDPGPGHWLYLLEKAGHWPISWTEFHRARTPTPHEASLLEIPTSLPVLEIVRVGTSGGDGQPIEVTEYIVASDRVETVHVLHRDQSAQTPWPDIQGPPDEIETDR
ncbi:GntR family transcriptional regulator [[Actinomadura] parvosata]|uniref:GntR family transcriptional regulator n=1 Tax=[Actinomadura] parvosata TaxID=1955412 RepID=UPI00406CAAD3